MYESTKKKILRFYLCTKTKPTQASGVSDVMSPDNILSDAFFQPINVPASSDDDMPVLSSRKNSTLVGDKALPVAADEKVDIVKLAAMSADIVGTPSDNEIDFAPFSFINENDLNDTILYEPIPALPTTSWPLSTPPQPRKAVVKTFRIRRSNVMMDFLTQIEPVDPFEVSINIEMIMPNGEVEVAEDNGGVLRDCLAEFWSEFYQKCTIGVQYKIPYLRHDIGQSQWDSIGKVIVVGYNQQGYFPIMLSKAFMENCLFGEIYSDLTTAFLEFLPASDRETLKTAMSDFDAVTIDDLYDILENYHLKSQMKKENVARIISAIANKTIVQEPAFVSDVWRERLKKLSSPISKQLLDDMYTRLNPTSRRVIQCLKFPKDLTESETETMKHLKRFIKDLDNTTLKKFVRFVTGADLLISESIEVQFVSLSGAARRPVAHTCGRLLELPKQYENYPVFKSEFYSILESSVWVMDIV